MKRTLITKRFPKKRNGSDDGARRSKNELDQWKREIEHRKSYPQGEQKKTGEEGTSGTEEHRGIEGTRRTTGRKNG